MSDDNSRHEEYLKGLSEDPDLAFDRGWKAAMDSVSPSTEFRVAKEAIEEKVKLQIEVKRLKRTLNEALKAMSEWDDVWYALYRPGTLGSSKAKQSLEEIHRMNRLIEQLIHEIENPSED